MSAAANPAPVYKSLQVFNRKYPVPIFYDLETTGLDVESDAVVQVAARVCPRWLEYFACEEKGDIGAGTPLVFHRQFVKPDCEIDEGASAVHGIREADVENGAAFADVMCDLQKFCDAVRVKAGRDAVMLVAHNNFSFDGPLLANQCARARLPPLERVVYGDTLFVAVRVFGIARRMSSLESLRQKWRVDAAKQTHDARDDVDLLIGVVAKQPDFYIELDLHSRETVVYK